MQSKGAVNNKHHVMSFKNKLCQMSELLIEIRIFCATESFSL